MNKTHADFNESNKSVSRLVVSGGISIERRFYHLKKAAYFMKPFS